MIWLIQYISIIFVAIILSFLLLYTLFGHRTCKKCEDERTKNDWDDNESNFSIPESDVDSFGDSISG